MKDCRAHDTVCASYNHCVRHTYMACIIHALRASYKHCVRHTYIACVIHTWRASYIHGVRPHKRQEKKLTPDKHGNRKKSHFHLVVCQRICQRRIALRGTP